jgi:DNA-binding response OmpR family regulator
MVEHAIVRVLVVDDDPDILTFVELVLRNAGYDVVVAAGGLD